MESFQIIEIVAVVFGVLSVWYAHKENIWVFPLGIINVLIYIYICISTQLYANAGINVVYFLTNVYGWYNWSRTNNDQESLQISRNTNKQNALWLLFAAVLYGVTVWILRTANQNDPIYLNSILPWIEGMNTSFFLCATVLMTVKKIENWWFWNAGNVISIPVYFSQGLYFTSLQYAIFLVIAIMGLRGWNKRWAERRVV
ncbi:MAG: nicotinamide mononucleotide transporter [Bacteroidales bacterium]|nr:nicotinamide mononucleotide transporter [Bacteroidales bacterium]